MQLTNTFTVSLPVEETWQTFLDLPRIAPCLPGAALTNVDGEDFHGGVKIKVGPVSAQYKGVARFVEKDDANHRAVISARGKDVGGQGNANATITATLTPQGDGTQVQVQTDLDLSGRVAQFGRGVIGDVTNKLLNQFVKNLENEISNGTLGRESSSAPTASAPPGAAPSSPRFTSLDDVEPLDVMGSMGGTIAKYALPAVGGLAAVGLGVLLLARGGRGAATAPSPVTIIFSLPGGPLAQAMAGRA
jgi:carbon monoxide dehydrogenase subunit G